MLPLYGSSLESSIRRSVAPETEVISRGGGAGMAAAMVVGVWVLLSYFHMQACGKEPIQDAEVSRASTGAPANDVKVVEGNGDQEALQQALKQATARAKKHWELIKTTRIRMNIISRGRGRPGMTLERCRELLAKHDLVKHPESMRALFFELYDEPETVVSDPWPDSELYSDGVKIRQSTPVYDRQFIHITDGKLSLRSSDHDGRVQVDIEPIAESRLFQMNPREFWQYLGSHGGKPGPFARLRRDEGKIFAKSAAGLLGVTIETVTDEATGFKTGLIVRDNGERITSLKHWIGWTESPQGIPYPRAIVDFGFSNNQLVRTHIHVIREMRLNVPLLPTVFQMEAPANSTIVDYRIKPNHSVMSINRDVFDVTSAEQLAEARKPLPPDPMTPLVSIAFVELRRLYSLNDKEVIKRIGPPFPGSRKHLPRLIRRDHIRERGRVRADLITWTDAGLEPYRTRTGFYYSLSDLLCDVLKISSTSIEGKPELLKREIPGDFVFRPDASPEELLAGLSQVAGEEFQMTIKLKFHDVERPVSVARGELKLSLLPGHQQIALNSGPYEGDHGEVEGGGTVAGLVREVAEYTGQPVIDETQKSDIRLSWYRRWYDTTGTPPEKRFKKDPAFVRKLISNQTGIQFVEEKRKIRILSVFSKPD